MHSSYFSHLSRNGIRAAVALVVVGLIAALITLVWDAGDAKNAAGPGSTLPPDGSNSAPAQPGSPARQPMSLTITATGDVLAYPSIIAQSEQDAGGSGHDFGPILADVRPIVSEADLAICHMETPYAPPEGPFTGYPTFAAPPQIASALAAVGYDTCSTASNHSLDGGSAGVRRTLDTLDAAGVRHAGTARDEAEAAPTIIEVKGVKVAHLSWTYSTNGIPLPDDKPWSVNVIDRDRIIEQARAARAAGAELVVLSVHWGTEWQTEPDEQQRSLSRELTASTHNGVKDLDLILGTHNHVPQAYEQVNGTWVVYGMGNEMANFPEKPHGNYSSAARFTFARDAAGVWTVARARFSPLFSEPGPPFRLVDVNRVLADPGTDASTRARLETVRAWVADATISEGGDKTGLTEAK